MGLRPTTVALSNHIQYLPFFDILLHRWIIELQQLPELQKLPKLTKLLKLSCLSHVKYYILNTNIWIPLEVIQFNIYSQEGYNSICQFQ